MLRLNLIPRLLHQLILGRTTKGILKKIDGLSRKFVRHTLRLPNDTPIAYLHAPFSLGGLQIPHLASSVPLMKGTRIEKLLSSDDPILRWSGAKAGDMLLKENTTPHIAGVPVRSKQEVYEAWKLALQCTFDANRHLGPICVAEPSDSWVRDPSHLKPGTFIRLCSLRCGLLPTKARKARQTGADESSRLCSYHCGRVESLSHILQCCAKTSDVRIHRHNTIVNLLRKQLSKPNRTVLIEPIIPAQQSFIKPDILVIQDNTAIVIDVSVVDPSNLARAYDEKSKKYGTGDNAAAITAYLRRNASHVQDIRHIPCIMSYNGLILAKSSKKLAQIGIRRWNINSLCLTAAVGSLKCYDTFHRGTN